MADDSDFVWLEWPETGHRHQFGVAAAEAWQGKGWVPCDPPPEEPDPRLRDPEPPAEPEPEPEPEQTPKPKKAAARPPQKKVTSD
jgi:hypothetical protein